MATDRKSLIEDDVERVDIWCEPSPEGLFCVRCYVVRQDANVATTRLHLTRPVFDEITMIDLCSTCFKSYTEKFGAGTPGGSS